MALSNWQILVITVSVIVISLSLRVIISEIFPWRNLRQQKNAKLASPKKSFKGKTVLITGANGAFGSNAARIIADLDVETLILVDVRDCTALKHRIEAETKATTRPDIQVWQVDMMSYQSCQAFAKRARGLKSLDSVLLVAGILSFNRQESPQGWETTIQVNYLSTALIALLLLPALKSSPSNPEPPVMSFVTTFAVYPALPFMWAPRSGSFIKSLSNNSNRMQGHQYGRSKALLLYFARELASRISASQYHNVIVNSVDPGAAWTPLTNPNQSRLIPRLIMNFAARDVVNGAKVLVNGASSTERTHGRILLDYDVSPYPRFMDRSGGRRLQQRIWQETRDVFEEAVPDVRAIYAMFDRK